VPTPPASRFCCLTRCLTLLRDSFVALFLIFQAEEKKITDAEENFKAEVEKLQATYEKLSKSKVRRGIREREGGT